MIKISRSKIELFLDCPRCFWLEMKKGVKRPPSFPYTINSAIDVLLKKEFDVCRENGTAHYIIKKYNINAIPYKCDQINTWRTNFTGVQFHHKSTDFLVFGAVDDVWVNPEGKLSFDLFIELQEGDSFWVEGAILGACKALDEPIPEPKSECSFCQFAQGAV